MQRMPEGYKIPDDPDTGKMDAAYLRSCCGLRAKPGEVPPDLPVAVRRAYYDMARTLSILGATGPAGMDPTQLATVICLAQRDPDNAMDLAPVQQAEEEDAPTFMDESMPVGP